MHPKEDAMENRFLEVYYKGRRVRRWRSLGIILVSGFVGATLAYILEDSVSRQWLIDVILLPTFLTLIGLVVSVSRRSSFLIPFWGLTGIVLGTIIRMV